jgi:hypothetical protein
MASTTIHRRVFPDNDDAPHPRHEAHYYPFKTLGKIKSHMPPHYAIFNCGERLQALLVPAFVALRRTYGKIGGVEAGEITLNQIVELHKFWTTVTVPKTFYETYVEEPRRESDSASSERSRDNQSGGGRRRKRKRDKLGGLGIRQPSISPAPRKGRFAPGERNTSEDTTRVKPQDDNLSQDSVNP